MAAALAFGAIQTPLYHASSTIEVQGITDNFLKSQDGNPNAGADSEVLDIQTQIRIIQSDSLVQPVAARLESHPAVDPAVDSAAAQIKQRDSVRRAVRSLSVRPAGQTRIIEIAADSTDPRIAARFVNALSDEFISQHIEARWQGSQLAAEKLKHAIEDVRAKLEQSEEALQKEARDSGLFLNTDRTAVSEEKLRLLQEELSRAEADRVFKQARFDSVAHSAPADLESVLEDPATQTSRAQLTDLRRQLAEYATTYTSNYSKVKRLEAQIIPLEVSIAKETAGTMDRIRNEYEQAREREQILAAAYREQTKVVSSDAEKKVRYDVLRHEVDSTRALYDTMLARVKEAGIAATMRGSNVRVLDSAKVPSLPYRPDFAQLALLGLLGGVFAGGFVLIVREQTDHTIRSPEDVRTCLDAPELGVIPGSPGAEPFRSIAASLRLHSSGTPARVLAITSPRHSEGKTSITAQLAGALADTGKRVLVIDGDVRSPRLHLLFDSSNDAGLADLLSIPAPLAPAAVTALLRKTSRARLEFLPAGNTGPHSPDLLYSPRLTETLEHARNIFDIVLIDTPPLLQFSDARVIGRASDAVVLVTRSGRTTRDDVLAFRQRLAEDTTPMIGYILNDWNDVSRANRRALRPGISLPQPLVKHTSA